MELLNNAADAGIIPSYLNEMSDSVYAKFEVLFKGSDKRSPLLSVGQGRELTRALASSPPIVVWSAPSGGGTGSPRTIAMVSRDGKDETRNGGKSSLRWMVVDVKGDCNSTHCTYDPAGDPMTITAFCCSPSDSFWGNANPFRFHVLMFSLLSLLSLAYRCLLPCVLPSPCYCLCLCLCLYVCWYVCVSVHLCLSVDAGVCAGGESSGTEVFPYSGPVPPRGGTRQCLVAAYDQPFDSDFGKDINEEGGLESIKDDFSLDQFGWKHKMVGDGAKALAWFNVYG